MSKEIIRRVELWLKRGDELRRPLSRNSIPADDFEEQQEPGVAYVVYERIRGTYSDGKGGRPTWQNSSRSVPPSLRRA